MRPTGVVATFQLMGFNYRGTGRQLRWLAGSLLFSVLIGTTVSVPAGAGKELRYRYVVNGGAAAGTSSAEAQMNTFTGDRWALSPISFEVQGKEFAVTVDDEVLIQPGLRPLFFRGLDAGGQQVMYERICIADGVSKDIPVKRGTVTVLLEVRNHETTQYGGWCFGAVASTGSVTIEP